MVSTVRIKRMKSEMDSFGGYVAPLSMLDAEKDIAVIFFTIRTRRKNEQEGEGGREGVFLSRVRIFSPLLIFIFRSERSRRMIQIFETVIST